MTKEPSSQSKNAPPNKAVGAVRRAVGSLSLFPIRRVVKQYNGDKFGCDLRAGINVALLAFPQGMAYALIAGLPIQYGIYGSAIATLIGCLFAGSHYITLGPTNATSVLLFLTFASIGLDDAEKLIYLPLLIAMVGVILVVGAYLRVASLIQFISRTVVTGYITAAAAYIIGNQVRTALGFSFDADETPEGFIDVIYYTLKHIPDTDLKTLLLSAITFIVFWVLKHYFKTLPGVAITLIGMSGVAWLIDGSERSLAYLTSINASEWPIAMPTFDLGIAQSLFVPALTIALLAVLEGASIGKTLAAKQGSRLNANQEMFSIGMANIGCSVFSGMPASGSLTRSVLNIESGAKTPLGAFYSGILCAVGAFLVGGYIQYIPRAALAIVVVFIGISLVNLKNIKMVVNARRGDAIVFFITILTGLIVALDVAIYLGTAVSIGLFLRKVARPEFTEYAFAEGGELKEIGDSDRQTPEISIVHVEGDLFFGAAELFRDQLRRICEDPNLKILILKTRNAHHLDASAMMALEELISSMNSKGRYLVVCEAKKETIEIIRRSGVVDLLEERNLIPDDPSNPTLSAAKALKRAQEQLGEWAQKAKVSVYVGETEFKG